jgi:CrcB protein
MGLTLSRRRVFEPGFLQSISCGHRVRDGVPVRNQGVPIFQGCRPAHKFGDAPLIDAAERYLIVGLGGALGAMVRYFAGAWFGFTPLTTFGVNITGSFLIGLLTSSAVGTDYRWRLLLGTGFLGGYTTFSTLSLEAMLSWRTGGWWPAALNLLASAVTGVAAAVAGFMLGGRFR